MFKGVRAFYQRHEAILSLLPGATLFFLALGGLAAGCNSCYVDFKSYSANQDAMREKAREEQGIEGLSSVNVPAVGNFIVVHDKQRGVTCWIAGGGISCIPDSELKK